MGSRFSLVNFWHTCGLQAIKLFKLVDIWCKRITNLKMSLAESVVNSHAARIAYTLRELLQCVIHWESCYNNNNSFVA